MSEQTITWDIKQEHRAAVDQLMATYADQDDLNRTANIMSVCCVVLANLIVDGAKREVPTSMDTVDFIAKRFMSLMTQHVESMVKARLANDEVVNQILNDVFMPKARK